MRLEEIEKLFRFNWPEGFGDLHQELRNLLPSRGADPACRVVSAEEMVDRRSAVPLPDVLPVIIFDDGLSICYSMPVARLGRPGVWVLFHPETNGIASLGSSLRSVPRSLAIELEARALEGGERGMKAEQVDALHKTAFDLLWMSGRGDDQSLKAVKALDATVIGFGCCGCDIHVLGTRNRFPAACIPYFECQRSQYFWQVGDGSYGFDMAGDVLKEDDRYAAAYWGLGCMSSARGDMRSACNYFLMMLSGNWCSFNTCLADASQPWVAQPEAAAELISAHSGAADASSRTDAVRKIIIEGRFNDGRAWLNAADRSIDENQHGVALDICFSSLAAKSWDSHGAFRDECVQRMKDIYTKLGMKERVEHLSAW